jgi:hypothetical protein
MTILLRLLLVTCALISPALLRAGKQDEANPWVKPGSPPPLLPGKSLTFRKMVWICNEYGLRTRATTEDSTPCV